MKNVSCQDLKERERKNKSLLECISITTGCYESVLSYFFPFLSCIPSEAFLLSTIFSPPQIFSLTLSLSPSHSLTHLHNFAMITSGLVSGLVIHGFMVVE